MVQERGWEHRLFDGRWMVRRGLGKEILGSDEWKGMCDFTHSGVGVAAKRELLEARGQ